MAFVKEVVTSTEDIDEARVKQARLGYSALETDLMDLDKQVIN